MSGLALGMVATHPFFHVLVEFRHDTKRSSVTGPTWHLPFTHNANQAPPKSAQPFTLTRAGRM